MHQLTQQQKNVIFISFAVISLVSLIYWLVAIKDTSLVTLNIAPEEASLIVNDKAPRDVKRGQSIRLDYGENTLTLTKTGFKDKTTNITVSNSDEKTIAIALEPISATARDYYANDPESKLIYEGTSSAEMSESVREVTRDDPVLAQLPFNFREYSAYLCPSIKNPNDQSNRAVCVDLAVPQVRDMTVKSLKDYGFNFDRHEIYITDDPRIRPIITKNDYRVAYSVDLKADKPVLLVDISSLSGSPEQKHQRIIEDLKKSGYQPNDSILIYADSDMIDYNTDPYLKYPEELK